MSTSTESPGKNPKTPQNGSPLTNENVCHSLPCQIDYQGMASTHVYFQPMELPDEGVLCGTFRGRGLLAPIPREVSGDGDTVLLSVQQDQVLVKAKAEQFLEWKHEHNPGSLPCDMDSSSRIEAARDWIETARALHDPIPLDDE